MRPIEERRRWLAPAMRDVASLLLSFDHVSSSAERSRPGDRLGAGRPRGARHRRLAAAVARAVPAGLRDRSCGGPARRSRVDETLLDGLAVAKECDEFVYAATYLPDWLYAPHAGMARLLGRDARAGEDVGMTDRRTRRTASGTLLTRPSATPFVRRSSTGTTGRVVASRSAGPPIPYLVLVSETILQQTQVARGAPAWTASSSGSRPSRHSLPPRPGDVLRAWRGLGYNRRAINLQRAARIVVDELGGRFPTDVAGLERLPGVGPYTARAVASIAFGLPVGAVDTNVRRVLGRTVAGEAGAIPPREPSRRSRTRSWRSTARPTGPRP